jgi:hypothetical protein
MEDSSGWKRIEWDFGKFIVEIPPPQCPSFPFIQLIPKQCLRDYECHNTNVTFKLNGQSTYPFSTYFKEQCFSNEQMLEW